MRSREWHLEFKEPALAGGLFYLWDVKLTLLFIHVLFRDGFY